MKKLINSILIIIIIVCISIIGDKYYNYNKDNNTNKEIQKLEPIIIESSSKKCGILEQKENSNNEVTGEEKQGNEEGSINANEEELKSINSNYKIWIQIQNTNINYPVVQGADNEFYLNHNFKGESNISGTIFIESENDIDNDKNIILYGHNMRNGTMFNNITKYKDSDFFYENNKINIIMNNTLFQYEVFSVYVDKVSNINLDMNFVNNEEFITYANNEKKKSMYNSNIDFKEDDKLLTLMTCSYEFTDARTVVVAKMCD